MPFIADLSGYCSLVCHEPQGTRKDGSFMFFEDAVQRMLRLGAKGETAQGERGMPDVRTETNLAARKF